jgi:acyl-[acyl-carrier-protein]-phospholipid O-acyltransferase/long-chain-fatty-acid--[acyl-carrier-protein] ligase
MELGSLLPLSTRLVLGDLPPWKIGIGILAGCLGLVALLCLLLPQFLWRLLLSFRARSRFRLVVTGIENVPSHGALLVCNSVAHLDWLLVVLALKRPVRCVLVGSWARDALAHYLQKRTGAIAVDAGDTRTMVRSLATASEALGRGEIVCVFAGRWSFPSGLELDCGRLIRRLMRRSPVPIVPTCISQRWGSLFHLEGTQIIRRAPIESPHPVEVIFGKPLPPSTSPGEVHQAVQRLGSDAAVAGSRNTLPAHRRFVRMASHHPLRPCLLDSISGGPTLSYGKVLAGAMCLVRRLRSQLGDAHMVAVWLPPGAGGALSNIALALMGKTTVNLNYTAGGESIQSALRQCGIKHVLTARRFTSRVPLDPGPGVEPIYLDELLPQIGKGEKFLAFLKVLLLPRFVLERWVLGLNRHSLETLATIIFSSGSTGDPKGVMLSHRNIAANAESMIQLTGMSNRDCLLGVLPFFHSFGYAVTLWTPLVGGASAVYHTDPRQAKEIGDLCRRHRCTVFLNTPTFLRFCLKKCEHDDFRSLRLLICGAEKLPSSLALEFYERFGVQPLEGYGCTELSPAAAANLPDTAIDGIRQVNNRLGTIGPPLPGVSARVIDPDTEQTLPLGQEGLLLIHGANVMEGYLHNPELTEKVLIDHEYVTGDMARIDEDGCITLTGRLSRFAKIGGEMVPLEKIEEELHGLLQTSERVLAVAAVPDEKRGERLIVLHLEHLDAAPRHLCRALNERGLPNLWVPGERDFFPVHQLPVLGSGKLDLKRVKDLALSAVQAR